MFTGFNWPVLAARLARRLENRGFVQVVEGGAAFDRDTPTVLTSTTDHFAYGNAMCFRGSIGDVLLNMVARCDRVVLDAANVDLAGRTNSSAIGPFAAPTVRLPGGGGGPDAVARARSLVLLHAGKDPSRIQQRVEHVTTAPAVDSQVQLITRWGTLELGSRPRLLNIVDHPSTPSFLTRLEMLGVETSEAVPARTASNDEIGHCVHVLREADAAGYRAAREVLHELVSVKEAP